MKKVEIRKKISNKVEPIYPKTTADIVLYDDGRSVSEVIASILAELVTIKEVLGIAGSVYSYDSNGNYIDDEDGTHLIMMNYEPAASNSVYAIDENGDILNDGSDSNLVSLPTLQ